MAKINTHQFQMLAALGYACQEKDSIAVFGLRTTFFNRQ